MYTPGNKKPGDALRLRVTMEAVEPQFFPHVGEYTQD